MIRRPCRCPQGLGLLAAAILTFLPVGNASAGGNYAFLVAVGDYDRTELKPLKYTRADILEFRQALVDAGFPPGNIVLLHDDTTKLSGARFLSTADNIRDEFDLLLKGLEKGDTLIVAFAGHGIQFKGEAESYFCPRNARLSKRGTLISFADLLRQMHACEASRKLLLVDACRNQPQTELARSRAEVNLESVTRPQAVEVPKSLLAFFSCGPGQQSFEDPDLGHGVFFHHILKGWKGDADSNRDEKLDLDELQSYVRRETKEYARVSLKALQTPQLKGEISDEWILRSLKTPARPLPNPDPTPGNLPKSIASATTRMKLMLIPAGEYLRGTSDAEIDRLLEDDKFAKRQHFANEQPRHRVRITTPFHIGRAEVTQAEWATVMGTNPSTFSKTGSGADKLNGLETSSFPVARVSWFDAVEYCVRLSGRDGLPPYYRLENVERNEDKSIKRADVTILEGQGYRLPTEAEWEYAARAGTTTRFHFGDVNNGKEANVNGEIPLGTPTKGPFLQRTAAVGSYAENQFGLVDVCGNVWEWCEDWYDAKAYQAFASETAPDPRGGGDEKKSRVLRGGSWNDLAWSSRSAFRYKEPPGNRSALVGFRIARTP